ncbi:MAG: hypothetical protein L7F77_04400 [Candidatus Magnetominusculus sp. LBB02]|nr:hypothetical protein [Candidatus Magnetominusculus sp. LBB02]
MANKKQIMDKLSALNLATPTKTRTHEAAAPAGSQTPEPPQKAKTHRAAVVEAKQAKPSPPAPPDSGGRIETGDFTLFVDSAGQTMAVAEINQPIFSGPSGVCTFTLFVDNITALMKISEEFQNNLLSINSMMIDSYRRTLTITFDTMIHTYGQFVESLKDMIPSALKQR